MNTQQQLVENFYAAFNNKDYDRMAACYHDEIEFSDPVFKDLKGKEVAAMWHMLLSSSKDLKVELKETKVNETFGKAKWEATYTFSKTGKLIRNHVTSEFHFSHDKILMQDDSFDLGKWIKMAFGTPAVLLGWTGVIQKQVRKKAEMGLSRFIEKNPQYQQ